jgi:hypothetical protein
MGLVMRQPISVSQGYQSYCVYSGHLEIAEFAQSYYLYV